MAKPLVQSTGRRKRAVARVRLRTGEGAITINKRPFEDYFPSETHRTLATEPLRIAGAAEQYDVDATIDGGGISGQAGALRLGIARGLIELDGELRGQPQEGRHAHARRPREGEQEVRLEEGPQGSSVLEALRPPMAPRFGTDGIRGVAGTELTPELALALGRAAATARAGIAVSARARHPPFGHDAPGRPRGRARRRGCRRRGRRRHPDPRPRLARGRPRRARRDGLGLTQPLRRQRHQAARRRRHQARHRARGRHPGRARPAVLAVRRSRVAGTRPASTSTGAPFGRGPAGAGIGLLRLDPSSLDATPTTSWAQSSAARTRRSRS